MSYVPSAALRPNHWARSRAPCIRMVVSNRQTSKRDFCASEPGSPADCRQVAFSSRGMTFSASSMIAIRHFGAPNARTSSGHRSDDFCGADAGIGSLMLTCRKCLQLLVSVFPSHGACSDPPRGQGVISSRQVRRRVQAQSRSCAGVSHGIPLPRRAV